MSYHRQGFTGQQKSNGLKAKQTMNLNIREHMQCYYKPYLTQAYALYSISNVRQVFGL